MFADAHISSLGYLWCVYGGGGGEAKVIGGLHGINFFKKVNFN